MVEIVAAEHRVATGRHHLEHATCQAQHRHVEGAAAEVVDEVEAFPALVEPVGQGRGGGLVQEAQHGQAGESRGVLRGLALRVVEVGGHRDHGADECAAECALGTQAQAAQHFGADVDRALHALAGAHADGAGRQGLDCVGQCDRRHVVEGAADQPLRRRDGVRRVDSGKQLRVVADDKRIGLAVVHDRGQQQAALRIGQHRRHRAAHGGDERVGGAEVDADRLAVLVWRRRAAGFGDLQKRHRRNPVKRRTTRRSRRWRWRSGW